MGMHKRNNIMQPEMQPWRNKPVVKCAPPQAVFSVTVMCR